MAGVFSYESSEIDWCEDNYKHSEHVAEYFNTVRFMCLYSSSYVDTWFTFFVGWNIPLIKSLFFFFLNHSQKEDWLISLLCCLIDVFPTDEQLYFLHYISHHALPSAPLCQREEPGDSLSLDHDDICRSVTILLIYS